MSSSFAELKRPFTHRNYRLLFIGQCIVLIGGWMQSIALSWLIYRLTGSALLLGTTMFLSQLPNLFLTVFGGIIADRYDIRKILRITQFCSMSFSAIISFLIFTDLIEIWHIFIMAMAGGTIMAIESPARQAFVIKLVGRDDLRSAIAMNSSVFNAARMVGPVFAGVLIPILGEAWLFLLNALCYIAPIICLTLIDVEYVPNKTSGKNAIGSIIEGVQYTYKNKLVLLLILMIGCFTVVHTSYNVLFPVISVEMLQGSSSTLGMLTGSLGFGALIGALFLASQKGSSQSLIYFALGGALVSALGIITFSYSTNFYFSCFILVIIGMSFSCQMAAINTSIQLNTADEFRGRVMSLFNMMFAGLMPLGSLSAGYLSDLYGPEFTIKVFGFLGLFFFFLFLPVVLKYNKRNRNQAS